jgi:cation/acetate symporter
MVLVGPDAIRAVDAGGNMAAPLLAEALGGTPFLGFIAAVAFATILAVVAGLTLSGAAALSHDLWVNVARGGHATPQEQLRVARAATIVLAVVAVMLGITFKGQNVAYMVGLAFAIAASANFPALVLSIFWRRCTTAGVVASMVLGTAATLTLIYLSPTIQVDILKHESAVFPLRTSLVTAAVSSRRSGLLLLNAVAAGYEVEREMHTGHVISEISDKRPAGWHRLLIAVRWQVGTAGGGPFDWCLCARLSRLAFTPYARRPQSLSVPP